MKGRKFLDCYVVAGGGSGLSGGQISPARGGTSSATSRAALAVSPLGDAVSPARSRRNFGQILFMQDDFNLVLVEPGETAGFTVRAMAPLLFTEYIVDQSDRRRVTFIVKTAFRDAIPLMDRIGTEEPPSVGSSGYAFKQLSLLRAQRAKSIFAVTVLFETAQAGALAASFLERRKVSLVQERVENLQQLLASDGR